jgi:hypothetical protein
MTKLEFSVCMAVLTSGIGRSFDNPQKEAWYASLHDLPLDTMKYAVSRWLSERDSSFPTIAAIRQFATEESNGQRLTWVESWSSVLDAVRKYGHYQVAQGEDSLDRLTRSALNGIGGFRAVCDSDQTSVLAGQFRRAYEALRERVETRERLPTELRPRIANGQRSPEVIAAIENVASAMNGRVNAEPSSDMCGKEPAQ